MNKKKVVIYAGVLLVVPMLVFVGLVGSTPQVSINNNNDVGCNRIYDVNRDTIINFQDAGLCWVYIQSGVTDPYAELLYDVNCDGMVNFQDCGLIWVNRD